MHRSIQRDATVATTSAKYNSIYPVGMNKMKYLTTICIKYSMWSETVYWKTGVYCLPH